MWSRTVLLPVHVGRGSTGSLPGGLLAEMSAAKIEMDAITYSAAIGACEQGQVAAALRHVVGDGICEGR